MQRSYSRLFLFLLLVSPAWGPSQASAADAGEAEAPWSGSYRGGVLTERFRHQQAEMRRALQRREGLALLSEPARALREDAGNIAIIEGTGGVVVQPNFFDLNGSSLTFVRTGRRYAVVAGLEQFDEEARTNGAPLVLQDDDAEPVFLPFAFPFFGKTHNTAFVHSDGNLTFEEEDAASSSRTFSRAISGPPRIAPLFDDLNPEAQGAVIKVYVTAEKYCITWEGVPEFSVFGITNRQTFQLVLRRNGDITFHYRGTGVSNAVVGIMPGRMEGGEPVAADLSAGLSQPMESAVAEIFSPTSALDLLAAARRFYQNHDDGYDFLVLFNDVGLQLGGTTFASATGIRNRVLGIGDVLAPGFPVFDFGADFGSARRLQTFMNMGPLSNYPNDPTMRIPAVGENTTLAVITHEAGHRFLAYPLFLDPLSNGSSTRLLGRQLAHWSFFFNSKASLLEGNEIEDAGLSSPRFRTSDAVSRFSDLDQYLMGLRRPDEVTPSFVVSNTHNFSPGPRSAASPPETGVRFDGTRSEVTLDMITAVEGPRIPDSTVAQRDFRFAFVLLVSEGAQPSAGSLAKLENFRSQWEAYFEAAADQRSTAETELLRMLQLSTWPASGLVRGRPGRARIEIAKPIAADLDILLTTDNGGLASPSMVTIPGGATSVSFQIAGVTPGLTRLTAHASTPGYDMVTSVVQVRTSTSSLSIAAISGADQQGALGTLLPQPVVFQVFDQNLLPYSGVPVVLSASGNGAVTPQEVATDADGLFQASWRLATTGGTGTVNTLTASIDGLPESEVTVRAFAAAPPPVFSMQGIVNAASFNLGPAAGHPSLSPGSIVAIFGEGFVLGPGAEAPGFPLPLSLSGVRVTLDGIACPLLYISATQINAQIPFGVGGSSAEMEILTPFGTAGPITIGLAGTQPGIFADFTTGLGAITNVDDGSPVWVRPGRAGTFISVFATGLGSVSPPGFTGMPAPEQPLSETLLPVDVTVGGREAAVSFAGLAPGFAGLYQVNVLLPEDLPPGEHLLSLTVDGRQSNEVRIVVE